MARNKFDIDETLESPFSFFPSQAGHEIRAAARFQNDPCPCPFGGGEHRRPVRPENHGMDARRGGANKDLALLGKLAVFYTLIVLIGIVFTTIRSRVMAKVSNEIVYDIREDLFAHLQRLPFSYYDSRPAGKILVRVINYVNSVSDMLSNGIINSVLEIINVIFIIVFMYGTDPVLATVVVAGLPVFVAVILIIKPKQRRYWQEQSNKNSNYNAYLAESIDGVRVSQLFAREEENISIMQRADQRLPQRLAESDLHRQFSLVLLRAAQPDCVHPHVHCGRLLDRRDDGVLRRPDGHGAVCQPVLAADHQPGEHLQHVHQQHRLPRTDL